MQKITPFLWFDNNAVRVANFTPDLFKNSALEPSCGMAMADPDPNVMKAMMENGKAGYR